MPALQLAVDHQGPVIVSTATIALQRQLVERDLPRLSQALREPLGRVPSFAIFKGRGNYVCRHKLKNAPEDDADAALISRASAAGAALGAHVKRLHEWAEQTATGDRDGSCPGCPTRRGGRRP